MACYYGPNGEECECVQVPEDTVIGTWPVKAGEWIVRGLNGDPRQSIVDPAGFSAGFKQKYPRPEGRDRKDPPKPVPKRAA